MLDRQGMALAFDFGTVRIGVAVGSREAETAHGLAVVANREGAVDWAAIDRLVQEWTPNVLIIGEPVEKCDEENAWYRTMRKFCSELKARYDLPVERVNEDYSSSAARAELREQRLNGRRGKTNRGETDKIAATCILQTWFSERDAVLRKD